MKKISLASSAMIPLEEGSFRIAIFHTSTGEEIIALSQKLADLSPQDTVPLRIHSECFTGEVLGSLKCDCNDQLHLALKAIAKEGRGLLVYLRQEGRGIGLAAKIQAYAQQEQGLDTVEANEALGLPVDNRTYEHAAAVCAHYGLHRVHLLTGNPQKIAAMQEAGLEVVRATALPVAVCDHNISYLQTKRDRMGHTVLLSQEQKPLN